MLQTVLTASEQTFCSFGHYYFEFVSTVRCPGEDFGIRISYFRRRGCMKFVELTIKVPLPAPIVRIAMFFFLLYRRLRYGYPFRRIKLTRGKYAIVDPDDFERLNRYKWQCTNLGYARRTASRMCDKRRKRVAIQMHNVVCTTPQGMTVDHINRNRLDNRKANLRAVTLEQNNWNRKYVKKRAKTRYTGIYWNSQMKKWQVRLMIKGRSRSFGYYADEVEAAKVYDKVVKEYRGEYAVLNFPEKRGKKRAVVLPPRTQRSPRNK